MPADVKTGIINKLEFMTQGSWAKKIPIYHNLTQETLLRLCTTLTLQCTVTRCCVKIDYLSHNIPTHRT